MGPGRMIANSIPARLVATRMRVVWPRALQISLDGMAYGGQTFGK